MLSTDFWRNFITNFSLILIDSSSGILPPIHPEILPGISPRFSPRFPPSFVFSDLLPTSTDSLQNCLYSFRNCSISSSCDSRSFSQTSKRNHLGIPETSNLKESFRNSSTDFSWNHLISFS